MESYLKGLNKEQLEAAVHEEGPCMVLAGPGTGKTTVITARVANLIKKSIVKSGNILVVTFSKAAANEMSERSERLLKAQDLREVSFGTFHSVFYKLLRQYMGYKLEDLVDESQKYNIVRNIVKKLGDAFADDEEHLKSIISDMEYVISTMSNIESFKPYSCTSGRLKEIIQEYKEFKSHTRKYDYDDILNDCCIMLKNKPHILKEIRERFKYILVDEFQDINALQFETIKLMAEPLNNIFIVGDDDQSIYSFRGAAPDILLNFEKLYPGCRRIYLRNNYRTSGNILTAAISLINSNINRYSKELITAKSGGRLPVTIGTEDFEQEARAISNRIVQMRRSGREYSDFAVIYRTNLQSRAIIDSFMDAGIPFAALDGVTSIYNHWIFKDITSYLKLGIGLGNSSDIIRIINKPKRYIGRDTIERAERLRGNILNELVNQSSLNRMQINKVFELRNDLNRLKVMNPKNAVRYIRNVIGYAEYLKEYSASKGINPRGLIETIEEIESAAAGAKSTEQYLNHVDEVALKLCGKSNTNKGINNVKLLTMHKAKGLEFDIVFICGSVEGLAPYIKENFSPEDLEEERRLFYVAMTRAKEELYITVPKQRYGKVVMPSRFIAEFLQGVDYSSQVHSGQEIYHKIYYNGIIKDVVKGKEGTRIKVDFSGRIKELNLETCLKNEIIRRL